MKTHVEEELEYVSKFLINYSTLNNDHDWEMNLCNQLGNINKHMLTIPIQGEV